MAQTTVRLAGGLPDGNLSNLEQEAAHLLSHDPQPVYAVVRLTRQRLVEDDDQDGAEHAVLKVRAVEVFPGGRLPDSAFGGMDLAELLHAARAERVGDNPIPFEVDAEKLDQARVDLTDWKTDGGLNDVEMGEAWKDHFGETGGSWRDADARMIAEFLAAQAEADAAAEASDDADAADMAAGADLAAYGNAHDVPAATFTEQ